MLMMKYSLTLTLSALLVGLMTHSAFADNNGYSIDQQGAIADSLYYQIGGGSVITPALTRRNPQLLKFVAPIITAPFTEVATVAATV